MGVGCRAHPQPTSPADAQWHAKFAASALTGRIHEANAGSDCIDHTPATGFPHKLRVGIPVLVLCSIVSGPAWLDTDPRMRLPGPCDRAPGGGVEDKLRVGKPWLIGAGTAFFMLPTRTLRAARAVSRLTAC